MRLVRVRPTGLLSVPGLVLTVGCAHGTTLPEAAGQLKIDSRIVLDGGARRLGPAGVRPTVLLDSRKPCGGGRARRVWQGSVPLRRGPDPRVDLDYATDVSIGLTRSRGYRLERPPSVTRQLRTLTMIHDGSDVRLVVLLHGGPHPSMRVDGSTFCLPP